MSMISEEKDKLNPKHSELDPWEIVMYVLGLAFSFDGACVTSPPRISTSADTTSTLRPP